MSIPRAASASIDLSKRDLTLDLARVVCVLLVVVIHLLLVGVGTRPDGSLVLSRPAEAEPWFDGASWVGQIMPLFFVVGGFASMTAWRSLQRRNGDGADYVKSRVLRLAQPSLPLFLFYVVAIGGAPLFVPVPPELLDGVVIGLGSPLWFIAAYTLCQALVPFLAGLHARAPKRTILVLFGAVILVDVVRYTLQEADPAFVWLGLLNMLFVWPLVQQLGFWYADGWFDRRPWWQLVLISLGALAMLWPLTVIGPYDTNMLVNLNPPTLPLVFLGLSQAAFLRLLKRPLTALMSTKAARTIVFLVGTRLMTIYLWHLPLIVIFSGIALLIPGASPLPASDAWWWSRPLEYLLVLVALFGLSFLVGRWEQPRELGETPPPLFVGIAAVLTIVVPLLIIPFGLDVWLAIAGSVTFSIAILILGRWGVLLARRIHLDDDADADRGVPART
jgi:fucose 4-O-acetylase-like acetyltransferase